MINALTVYQDVDLTVKTSKKSFKTSYLKRRFKFISCWRTWEITLSSLCVCTSKPVCIEPFFVTFDKAGLLFRHASLMVKNQWLSLIGCLWHGDQRSGRGKTHCNCSVISGLGRSGTLQQLIGLRVTLGRKALVCRFKNVILKNTPFWRLLSL